MRQKPPLIGREEEFAFLDRQLAETRDNGARLVLLSGLSGVGKTSIAQRFLACCEEATTVEGRGWDHWAAEPFYSLRQVVQQLLDIYPNLWNLAAGRVTRGDLHPLLNGLSPRGAARYSTEELARSLATLVETAASLRPLCVFIDDLQWADEGTLSWLDYALQVLDSSPVLLLGAYRREDRGALVSLWNRAERWSQSARWVERELLPLNRSETEALCRTLHGTWNSERLEEVWQRSRGVPLFVLGAGQIRDQAGSTMRAIIDGRVSRLGEGEHRLLTMAALIGEAFAVAPLADALEEDPVEVHERLRHIADVNGLVAAQKKEWRFAHSQYREALLDALPEDVAVAYHHKLLHSRHLPESARTFHLVHGADPVAAAKALLGEGDRVLEWGNWRDALRYYAEAQSRVAGVEETVHALALEGMGYIYQLDVSEYLIALGYYEAALRRTVEAEARVRLLCRLAQVWWRVKDSVRERAVLRQAEAEAEAADSAEARALVACVQASRAEQVADLRRVRQLVEAVQADGIELPYDMREMLLKSLLGAAGRERNLEEVRACEKIEVAPRATAPSINYRLNVATAYRLAGALRAALERLQALVEECERSGRTWYWVSSLMMKGVVHLELGECEAAIKAMLYTVSGAEYLPTHSMGYYRTAAYSHLCKVAEVSEDRRGPDWAWAYLDDWLAHHLSFAAIDENRLSEARVHLANAESILCRAGQGAVYREWIGSAHEKLRAAGYWANWSPYLQRESEMLPQVEVCAQLADWSFEPGGPDAACQIDENGVVLSTPPNRGWGMLNMPRLTSIVRDDFVLEASLHGGDAVRQALRHCYEAAGAGRESGQVPGCGGLILLRNARDALVVFAHPHVPGQVLCRWRQREEDRVFGCGLLPDGGPVRLRLERAGAVVRAWAATDTSAWYRCFEMELPGWETARAGLFAECLVDLYQHWPESETRFANVRMQVANADTGMETSTEQPYPRLAAQVDGPLAGMVVGCAATKRLVAEVERIARAKGPVLIRGESGVGKELVARVLHESGPRADGPFVPINCAAVPAELIATELFGHVRGAYTGAHADRGGLFAAAHGGTLFLDEIGDAPLELQASLLRVVEEGAVRAVGASKARPVDVRIVAATNVDLQAAVEAETFRQDLFYRLTGHEIAVPPLRARRDEIPHLVFHIIDGLSEETSIRGITAKAMAQLQAYDWPGNVRQLLHEVRRAAYAAEGVQIGIADLSTGLAAAQRPRPPAAGDLDRAEIEGALTECSGNRSAAARRLGVHRATLYRRMRRLGIG